MIQSFRPKRGTCAPRDHTPTGETPRDDVPSMSVATNTKTTFRVTPITSREIKYYFCTLCSTTILVSLYMKNVVFGQPSYLFFLQIVFILFIYIV
jgi:hypothetical protein